MDWGTIGLYVCCGCLILLYLMQDRQLKALTTRCQELEKQGKDFAELLPPDDFADDSDADEL